jgi:hypothetical protein
MKPYQQRVIDEKNELDDKLNKLINFFSNPIFESLKNEEKSRLRKQAGIMTDYFDILNERISSFKDDE